MLLFNMDNCSFKSFIQKPVFSLLCLVFIYASVTIPVDVRFYITVYKKHRANSERIYKILLRTYEILLRIYTVISLRKADLDTGLPGY